MLRTRERFLSGVVVAALALAGCGPRRAQFDAQLGPQGALLIGEPEEVAEKILRHSESLGGIARIQFQMNASSLPHDKLMRAIELLGTKVAPVVRKATEPFIATGV